MLGFLDDTLVILTADHGEEFLEHGGREHGHSLYDKLIHVPLIIKFEGTIPEDKIIDKLVSHIDLMPTILDILNISSDSVMQGVSLLPLIEKNEGFTLPSEVYCEGYDSDKEKRLIGVRTEKWKFIANYESDRNIYHYELYDLEKDSHELENIVDQRPEMVELLKEKLSYWRKACQKTRSHYEKQYGVVHRTATLDEEMKKRLRALGYLQ